jgi:hypothetical protein
MDSPFIDLGKEIDLEQIQPSSGLALVLAAQRKYSDYCTKLALASIKDRLPKARQECRKNFIRIADEIYSRIPEEHR